MLRGARDTCTWEYLGDPALGLAFGGGCTVCRKAEVRGSTTLLPFQVVYLMDGVPLGSRTRVVGPTNRVPILGDDTDEQTITRFANTRYCK